MPVAQKKPAMVMGNAAKTSLFVIEFTIAVQEYRTTYRTISPLENFLHSNVQSLLIRNPTNEPQIKEMAFAASRCKPKT